MYLRFTYDQITPTESSYQNQKKFENIPAYKY